jgi:uncharacterized integral membrane protein
MGNLWLKIRVWTKVTIVTLIALYILLFIYNNSGEDVKFWWWFKHTQTSSVFVLSIVAFLAGALFAILARTTFTTIRQIGELRSRTRMMKLERDLSEQQRKASKLQTRSSVGTASSASVSAPAPSPTSSLSPHEEDIP